MRCKLFRILGILLVFSVLSSCGINEGTSSVLSEASSEAPPPSSQASSLAADSSFGVESKPEYYPDHLSIEYIDFYMQHDVNADLSVLQGETVKQLSVTGLHTFVLTGSGRLFSCGFNQYGILAQGSTRPVFGLVEIKLPEKVKMVCVGDVGACAVGVSNNIYFWGRCFDFTYDLFSPAGCDPICVPFDKEVAAIDLRLCRIVILTKDGEVYAFGENYNGYGGADADNTINGYDWTLENFLVPQKLQIPEPVVQIAATVASSFYLGKSGTCYTAFNPQYTNYPCEALPGNPYIKKIRFDQPVQSMGTGDETLFLLTKKGDVYAAGNNISLNAGIGQKKNSDNVDPKYGDTWILKRFARVPLPEKATAVCKSNNVARAFFLGASGTVYTTGENFRDWSLTGRSVPGKDSIYGETEYIDTPVAMKLPKPVTALSGRGAALWYRTAEGKIYACGLNSYGNILSSDRPFPIDEPYILYEPAEIPLKFSDDFQFQS